MISPGSRPGWASSLVVVLGASSLGLYVARTTLALLYFWFPSFAKGSLTLAAGASLTLVMVAAWLYLTAAAAKRRNRIASAYCSACLPLLVLSAVLLRPSYDLVWSYLVLASSLIAASTTAVLTWRRWGGILHPTSRVGALPKRNDRLIALARGQVGPLAIAAFALVIYLRTMAPSVVVGDSAEFQTAAFNLGIAHPTGYPLYLLLAKAFTYLPVGNVAYRVNLLSGLSAVAAVYFLTLAARRLTGNAVAAALAGLTFATGTVFWSQAVIAEVYALHAFFMAAMLFLMIVRLDRSAAPPSCTVASYALWLLFGFSLAHHRTALLILPALLASVLLARPRVLQSAGAVSAASVLTLVPLLLYLYLPLRWQAATGANLDWPRFQSHVLGSGYSFILRLDSLWSEPDRYLFFLGMLKDQFTIPGAVLGLLGLTFLALRCRRASLLTMLAFLSFALFPVVYHVPDVAVFFIPAFAVFALWLAVSIATFSRALAAMAARLNLGGGMECSLTIASLIPAFLLVTSYSTNDVSTELPLDHFGRAAIQQPVRPGAIIVADLLRMSSLRYFYGVEAADQGVQPVMPDDADSALKIVSDSVASGRPVYLARFLPGLETNYRLDAPGPLVEVTQDRPPSIEPAVRTGANLADGITLVGFTPGPGTIPAGQKWSAILQWRADKKQTAGYYVHLRLIDPAGQVVPAAQPAIPVQGLYPTWAWPSGQLVSDYHDWSLPIHLAPGRYEAFVGLGGQFSLPDRWASIGTLSVQAPTGSRGMQPTLVVFDGRFALLAYSARGALRPGGSLTLGLRWQLLAGAQPTSLRLTVALVGAGGHTVAEADQQWKPATPTESHWVEFHKLSLPTDLPVGTYRLAVRLDSVDGRPLTASYGWPPVSGNFPVLDTATVTAPPSAALANLENKILLVRHILEADELRSGETLRLTLYWQTVAKLDADYTVFVHLLDSSQRVVAQVDSYPGNGLRPTSQWRPNELIADLYEVRLPVDLPPGAYQIEAGMYLADSMQRLQVLGFEENPIDDRVLFEPLRVRSR